VAKGAVTARGIRSRGHGSWHEILSGRESFGERRMERDFPGEAWD
jgi:hypothetical protein